MDRRAFIQSGLASMLMWQVSPAWSVTNVESKPKKNLIWVVLRGALDPLHTIVPRNDNDLMALRPTLYPAIKDQLLALNNDFGFHPKLANLHTLYQNKQCLPIVAVSSGYQNRSHFEGQDHLETGQAINDTNNGWLARAIDVQQSKALALANATPVSLRGSRNASTWYPNNLKDADEELYSQLSKMYQNDESLLTSLEKGLELKGLVNKQDKTNKTGKFAALCKNCGELMIQSADINCAMLEVGGWDTHNRQANRLNQQLAMLDEGLLQLKTSLAHEWDNTIVVVATEFGRTAKENGTQGTDHGSASAMLLLGGKVNGGQVLGKWPGLKPQELFEGRDVMPTSNSFGWLAAVLQQHWQFSKQDLQQVFKLNDSYPYPVIRV